MLKKQFNTIEVQVTTFVTTSYVLTPVLYTVWAVWAVRAVREKGGFEEFCENFEGGFFNFWWSKQHFKDF